MQTSGPKPLNNAARRARVYIAAAIPLAVLLTPFAAQAQSQGPIKSVVCDVRSLVSPLLGSCTQPDEPQPQPDPSPAPPAASQTPSARPVVQSPPATSPRAVASGRTGALPPPLSENPAPSGRGDAAAPLVAAARPPATASPESLPLPGSAFAALDLIFTAAISGGLVWLIAARRKRTAERETAEAAAGVSRMKDEIVSNLSHELRTPLTPVVGYAKMLRSGKVPASETRKIAEKLIGASAQLERTIDLLVTYAAIRGGSFTPKRLNVTLVRSIENTVRQARIRYPGRAIELSVKGRVPDVTGDPMLLRNAVDQLIDNAVKFSPAGRPVEVTVAAAGDDPNGVEIAVTDHGIGISPGEIESIFDEFRQADASATRAHGGVGLGLAFVREVARIHRGGVGVRSVPGEGSVFTMRIAARPARPMVLRARSSVA